jgi:AcrR family transcriptional regulator
VSHRDTREALLLAGVELFIAGGYDFVGTNAILAKADAPRGSFYHHFENKQAFALAVAEYYYESHLPALDRAFGDEAQPPLARLRRYFCSAYSGKSSPTATQKLATHCPVSLVAGVTESPIAYVRRAIAESSLTPRTAMSWRRSSSTRGKGP